MNTEMIARSSAAVVLRLPVGWPRASIRSVLKVFAASQIAPILLTMFYGEHPAICRQLGWGNWFVELCVVLMRTLLSFAACPKFGSVSSNEDMSRCNLINVWMSTP